MEPKKRPSTFVYGMAIRYRGTGRSAQVVSNNLCDVFGVLRHPQGSAQTP